MRDQLCCICETARIRRRAVSPRGFIAQEGGISHTAGRGFSLDLHILVTVRCQECTALEHGANVLTPPRMFPSARGNFLQPARAPRDNRDRRRRGGPAYHRGAAVIRRHLSSVGQRSPLTPSLLGGVFFREAGCGKISWGSAAGFHPSLSRRDVRKLACPHDAEQP